MSCGAGGARARASAASQFPLLLPQEEAALAARDETLGYPREPPPASTSSSSTHIACEDRARF